VREVSDDFLLNMAEVTGTLIASNVDTAIRVRGVREALGSPALLLTEVVGTIGVVVLVVVPWLLGVIDPTREDLTWAILVSFATAFISLIATVMTAFDISRLRQPDAGEAAKPRSG
jgi:hypothetical protein